MVMVTLMMMITMMAMNCDGDNDHHDADAHADDSHDGDGDNSGDDGGDETMMESIENRERHPLVAFPCKEQLQEDAHSTMMMILFVWMRSIRLCARLDVCLYAVCLYALFAFDIVQSVLGSHGASCAIFACLGPLL